MWNSILWAMPKWFHNWIIKPLTKKRMVRHQSISDGSLIRFEWLTDEEYFKKFPTED